MIFEEINRRIKAMKEVRRLEAIKTNQEQQTATDAKFRKIVGETKLLSNALRYASVELKWSIPESLMAEFKSVLSQLAAISAEEYADREAVSKAEDNFKALQGSVRKEWSKHYAAYTAATCRTLRVVSGIQPEAVKDCMADLIAAKGWTTDLAVLAKLKEAMERATTLIESLNMDQDIVSFLTKMTSGSATIVELNEKVLAWLKAEGLERKIKLSFVAR